MIPELHSGLVSIIHDIQLTDYLFFKLLVNTKEYILLKIFQT